MGVGGWGAGVSSMRCSRVREVGCGSAELAEEGVEDEGGTRSQDCRVRVWSVRGSPATVGRGKGWAGGGAGVSSMRCSRMREEGCSSVV